jgi:hypothetical protein
MTSGFRVSYGTNDFKGGGYSSAVAKAGRPGRSAWVEGDVANLGMQIDDVGRVRVAGHRDVLVADGRRGDGTARAGSQPACSSDVWFRGNSPVWVSEGRLHQETNACSRQSSPLVTWPNDASGASSRASTPILNSAATARPGQFGPNGAGTSSPAGGSPRAGRARRGNRAPRGGDRAGPDHGGPARRAPSVGPVRWTRLWPGR